MLLPQEIAEQLSPSECMNLDEQVATDFHQKFGVVGVFRKSSRVIVVIELEDNTRHEVVLQSNQKQA